MRIRFVWIIMFALVLALFIGCSKSSDNTAGGSGASGKGAMDLSTKENAIRSIHTALRNGDKESFRKAVSSRMMGIVGKDFDTYYDIWRRSAEKMPVEKWLEESPKMTNEDGSWKLDER